MRRKEEQCDRSGLSLTSSQREGGRDVQGPRPRGGYGARKSPRARGSARAKIKVGEGDGPPPETVSRRIRKDAMECESAARWNNDDLARHLTVGKHEETAATTRKNRIVSSSPRSRTWTAGLTSEGTTGRIQLRTGDRMVSDLVRHPRTVEQYVHLSRSAPLSQQPVRRFARSVEPASEVGDSLLGPLRL